MSTQNYYHIWMEGFAITGQRSKAVCLTEKPILAISFNMAVRKYMKEHPDAKIQRNTPSRYLTKEAYQKRDSNWNIWGCNLYPDETSARKAFG